MPQQILSSYVDDAVARTRSAGDEDVSQEFEKDIAKVKSTNPYDASGAFGFIARVPRNVGIGAFRAALNTIETADNAFAEVAEFVIDPPVMPGREDDAPPPILDTEPVAPLRTMFPGVFEAAHNLADEAEAQSNVFDTLNQGIAQFVIPFTSYLKGVGGLREIPTLAKLGRIGLAEGVTAASAFEAHEGRFADLIEMGRQQENNFGALLNKISPEGSLANSYIEWIIDRDNEGEFEGRFKNAVDSLVSTAGIATLLKGVGTSFKIAKQVIDEVGTKLPGSIRQQSGAIGIKSNLTPAEKKFFDEIFGNDFDRTELLEEVSGITYKNGRLEVPSNSVDALTKYVDDTVILRAGETMEPRLPPSFHKDTFASKFIRDSARTGRKE